MNRNMSPSTAILATPLMGYYHGNTAQAIYFLVLMGLGIFFFLYIFIGSAAHRTRAELGLSR